LYGLKQAPRAWYHKLNTTLTHMGFSSSISDASLFTRFHKDSILLILIYVDDILITGNNVTHIKSLISTLHSQFALKDLGLLSFFLGIEAHWSPTGALHLSQTKYTQQILDKAKMLDAKPQPSPMISSLKLLADASTSFSDPTLYRQIVGALQYLTFTRPDITFSINKVFQFMHNPQLHHWQAVKRILRYIAGTQFHGIRFSPSSSKSLQAFTDADWDSDPDDRKSTSGYCVYFGNNIVSWSSKKQKVVSRSSTEAEYRSLASAMTDISWIQSLLHELHVVVPTPIIHCDNLGAVLLTANPIMHSRTKHFELDLHFIRDKVKHKQVFVRHIPARFQIADAFTKPISGSAFHDFRQKLTMVIVYPP